MMEYDHQGNDGNDIRDRKEHYSSEADVENDVFDQSTTTGVLTCEQQLDDIEDATIIILFLFDNAASRPVPLHSITPLAPS
jgi:hypothetical protein